MIQKTELLVRENLVLRLFIISRGEAGVCLEKMFEGCCGEKESEATTVLFCTI
jgi:hypothetical protein